MRLEWLKALDSSETNGHANSLRIHAQLFSGYDHSLVDYKRRRTLLSVGLSLVDF